jgi:hypothetical protein
VKYRTRAEWESNHRYNEPYPPWRLATWGERLQISLVWVALAFVAAVVVIGLLYLVGQRDELRNREAAEHSRSAP